jgi:hypothetical protein
MQSEKASDCNYYHYYADDIEDVHLACSSWTAIAPTKPSASKAYVIIRMIRSLDLIFTTRLVVEGICSNETRAARVSSAPKNQ